MIIYRPHRRALKDAMLEAKEFESIKAMKQYIVQESAKLWGRSLFEEEDIVIDEESFSDNRNGWNDTRYVCVKRMGDEDFMEKYGGSQCIGFCATDHPKKRPIENCVCKDCLHYQVCLIHCSESVLKNRGICEHFLTPEGLVKRGRWIDQIALKKCSLCKVHQVEMTPYCPECGAKMVED